MFFSLYFRLGYFFVNKLKLNFNIIADTSVLVGFSIFFFIYTTFIFSVFSFIDYYQEGFFDFSFILWLMSFCGFLFSLESCMKSSINFSYDYQDLFKSHLKTYDKLKERDKYNFVNYISDKLDYSEYSMRLYKKKDYSIEFLKSNHLKNIAFLDKEWKKRNINIFEHVKFVNDELLYKQIQKEKKDIILKEKEVLSKIYANKAAKNLKWDKNNYTKNNKIKSKIENI